MQKAIQLNCAACNKQFSFPLKYYKYRLKENPETKFYCGAKCRSASQKTGAVLFCANCNEAIYCSQARQKNSKTGNIFCSSHCNAIFSNKSPNRDRNGIKIAKCIICGEEGEIHLHASPGEYKCEKCYPKYPSGRPKDQPKIKDCIICGLEIFSSKAKYCDKCRKIRQSEAGRKSAEAQTANKRSKNEIYFAELCKEKFSEVLENAPIFNGWDADVIIPELSIAILWNGIWHHKKIREKHSLRQVQSRDKIKIKEIKKLNYIPYVIDDLGRYNPEFVEEKFEEFLIWLEDLAGESKSDYTERDE